MHKVDGGSTAGIIAHSNCSAWNDERTSAGNCASFTRSDSYTSVTTWLPPTDVPAAKADVIPAAVASDCPAGPNAVAGVVGPKADFCEAVVPLKADGAGFDGLNADPGCDVDPNTDDNGCAVWPNVENAPWFVVPNPVAGGRTAWPNAEG